MLKHVLVLLVFAAAWCWVSPDAAAQAARPDRLRYQVWRTRELLDFAGERVGSCGDERAGRALADALDLQARAEGALRQGRLLAAFQLTRGARERGFEALTACGVTEAIPQLARRALERTDRLLSREGPGHWVGPPPGRGRAFGGRGRMLREGLRPGDAARLQDDAWLAFRAGRFEAALRLTLTARSLAVR